VGARVSVLADSMLHTLQPFALQFGNGTRLDPQAQTGMGRFGMGMPSASISQCTRVEVWSWQDGVDSALYTYLDVDKIRSGEQRGHEGRSAAEDSIGGHGYSFFAGRFARASSLTTTAPSADPPSTDASSTGSPAM
jgi:hypothetical protein